MKTVIAYIRVSTSEQAEKGYSLDSQRMLLRDYANGHDLRIIEEIVERESAYKTGRPEFGRLVTKLASGEANAVLVYKLDRLARNLHDYSQVSQVVGAEIISATEALPSGASGKLVGGVQASVAEYYSALLSERTKLGMETKAKKGIYPTYAPIGYVNKNRNISIDPVNGPMVRDLFVRYAKTDDSLDDLSDWTKTRGIRSRYGHYMSKGVIHTILQNPVYIGQFRWRGKLYDGTHEPLISHKLYRLVQEKLHGRGAPLVVRREFPYRGLLTCGYCGRQLTAEMKKGKYVYYHCTQRRSKCPQPYYSQDVLSERLVDVVEGVRLSESLADQLIGLALGDDEQRAKERATRRIQLKAEEARIIDHMDAMYEDRLDGTIGEDQWLRRNRNYRGRLQLVREEIGNLAESEVVDGEKVQTIIELCKRLPEVYYLTDHGKRAELLKIVASNCIVTAENIEPVYREPYSDIAKWRNSPAWLPVIDSLRNCMVSAEQLELIAVS